MSRGPATVLPPHDHVVNFYDEDEHLVAEVTRFIADGLRRDEATVLVTTPAHREAIEVALTRSGIDVTHACAVGRLQVLDAHETLAGFMVDGLPDPGLFRANVGDAIGRAEKSGSHVRAFGEMVALLWEDGNVAGAVELETLWNELARHHRFSLYCAYRLSSLADNGDLAALTLVCDRHSDVVPPRSYEWAATQPGWPAGDDERSAVFVPSPTAIRAVRRFLAETVNTWGESEILADALLIGSELATNAVRHGASAFRVSVTRSEATLRIAVRDVCPQLPRRLDPAPESPGGRGVALVALISATWGSDPLPNGKVVWSELARRTHVR